MAYVETEGRGDLAIAHVVGEVDLSNVEEIAKALDSETADRARRHVVDLTRTTYFDSAGVRMLFALATRLRSRKQELIVVAPPSGVVRRIIDLTDVTQVCPVYESLDQIPAG
ncbi:MAG TPA: STAS domain-containing protein [Actinomycetota bacterium]